MPDLLPNPFGPRSGGVVVGGDPQVPPRAAFLDADDLALALPRGVEGAVRNLLGVVDILPGVETGITEARWFGRPDTIGGGVLTGVAEFAAGFVPVFGALGAAGRAASVARAGLFPRALRAVESIGGAELATAARSAAAGFGADFLVSSPHDARLSNLIQSYPALANPVAEFLQADPDDGAAEGRLKAALEGLGIGGAMGALVSGLKALRGIRSQVEEAIGGAIRQAGEDVGRLGEILRGPQLRPAFAGDFPVDDAVGGDLLDVFGGRGRYQERPDRHPAGYLDQGPLLSVGGRRPSGIGDSRDPVSSTPAGMRRLLEDALDVDPQTAAEIAEGAAFREADGPRVPGDPYVNPRDLTPGELLAAGLDTTDANLERFARLEGVGALIRTIEDVFGSAARETPRGMTSEQVLGRAATLLQELSDVAGGPPELVVARFRAMAAQQRQNVEEAAAYFAGFKFLEARYGRHVWQAAQDYLADPTPANRARMHRMVSDMAEISQEVTGMGSAFGFGLRTAQIPVGGPGPTQYEAIAQALADSGGAEASTRIARMFVEAYGEGGARGAAAINRLADASGGTRATHVTLELYMNSILSGGRTLAINGLSPALFQFARLGEQLAGGSLLRLFGQSDGGLLMRTWAELEGMALGVRDGLRYAARTWRTGRSVLDPPTAPNFLEYGNAQGQRAIQATTFGAEPTSILGRAVDFIGRLANLPSSVLGSTDEFSKQVVGRGRAYGELTVEGSRRGLTGTELAAFVEDGMSHLIYDGQLLSQAQLARRSVTDSIARGVDDPAALVFQASRDVRRFAEEVDPDGMLQRVAGSALDAAQGATFTRPLPEGGLSANLQRFIGQHPMLRFFAPFFRTPVNILKEGAQRAPLLSLPQLLFDGAPRAVTARLRGEGLEALAEANTRLVRDLGGDAATRGEALGRVVSGLGMTALLLRYAASGRLTGRGPSDPDMRKQLADAGWLPYSVRFGGRFYQYGRVEPFAIVAGITADLYEYGKIAPPEDQGLVTTAFASTVGALSSQITQKSYLQGLSDFFSVMESPETEGPGFLGRFLGATVPNALAQAAQAGDPLTRDLDTLVDRLRARVPGLEVLGVEGRRALPPLRNLLGEPVSRPRAVGEDILGAWSSAVSPILYRTVSDDSLNAEFLRLRHGFNPPAQTVAGVRLRDFDRYGQDAYDRWQQLQGTVKVRGRTLRQTLQRLVRSREYQRLPLDGGLGLDSPRVNMIRRAVGPFRARALDEVMDQYPDLARAVSAARRQQARARAGRAGSGPVSAVPTFADSLIAR